MLVGERQNPRRQGQTRMTKTLPIRLALSASIIRAIRPPYGEDDDDQSVKTIDGLVNRLGSAQNAANQLWEDNLKLRQKKREQEATITELKGKVPSEGTVVLTKEQAAEWDSYQKFLMENGADGKPTTLDAINKSIADGKASAETLAKRDRAEAISKAAADVKFNPEVLTQLAEHDGLTLTTQTVKVKDAQGNESDQRVHYVQKAGMAVPMELTAYANQSWAPFKASLEAQPAGQQQQQGQPAGQQWVGGGATGGGQQQGNPISSLVEGMVKARQPQQPGQQQQGTQPNTNQFPGTGRQGGGMLPGDSGVGR